MVGRKKGKWPMERKGRKTGWGVDRGDGKMKEGEGEGRGPTSTGRGGEGEGMGGGRRQKETVKGRVLVGWLMDLTVTCWPKARNLAQVGLYFGRRRIFGWGCPILKVKVKSRSKDK